MADGLIIDASQLGKRAKQFEALAIKFPKQIDDILNANALEIAAAAKRNAPADRGQIRQGISADTSKPLVKRITSQAPYSAFMEFGTGIQAELYISSLPNTYKEFASRFKGATLPGTFADFVTKMEAWIKRKGIGVTYTTGIVKKKGGGHTLDLNKATPRKRNLRANALKSLAYVIARSIMRNGAHPHPFLLPALFAQEGKMKRIIVNYLKVLKL